MIKQNFKLIIRGLKKNTIVSLINILGLVTGFTFVILTGMYVYTEKTFDHFHENHHSVSRIEWKTSDGPVICYTPGIMNQWLKNNIPEVKYTTRVANDEGFGGMERNVLYNQTKFKINNPLMVDGDFFTMFSFKILKGEIESFKTDKYSVALTGPVAAKIFGNENPIGKVLSYKGGLFVVRAIMEGVPANSSLQFEMLLPIENLQGVGPLQDWRNNCLQTYIQADSRIPPKVLQQKIHDGLVAQFKSLGFTDEASKRHFSLKSLDNIYYTESLNDNVCIHGNSKITSLMFALSVLVLLIALFNYTNAALANASESLKGVGIKSIAGASRTNNVGFIIWQSVVPCVFAMIIAVFLSLLTEDVIIRALNIPLVKLNFFQYITIIGAGVLLGILVGIYPAIKLTSYKLTDSLKKKDISGLKAINIGNVFSVAQFAASIVLVISVFTIYKQINFILKQSGDNLDKDVVMYMPLANRTEHKASNIIAIQEALKSLPEIKGVSTCLSLPGDEFYSDFSGFSLENNGEKSSIDVCHDMVDAGYPEVMGLNIVEGRTFDASRKTDVNTYLVNEAFIKKYQVHNISAAQLNGAPIIGIVKDFHYNSLYKEIKPLAMLYSDQYQSHIVIRLSHSVNSSLSEIVKKINHVVDRIDNSAISEVHFLDQHIAALYDREVKVSKVLFILALFSILISCMGLFSMSLFIVKKRTKEIGIRKINGARISEVMILLNGDFVKWVAIAFVIATPIAYYAMNKWLENFAYKTELSWWIFALAGLLALGIALLTVSWQSWRAATRNPVEALRYE